MLLMFWGCSVFLVLFFSGILIDPSHWPTSLDKNFIADFLIRQALNYETSSESEERVQTYKQHSS